MYCFEAELVAATQTVEALALISLPISISLNENSLRINSRTRYSLKLNSAVEYCESLFEAIKPGFCPGFTFHSTVESLNLKTAVDFTAEA